MTTTTTPPSPALPEGVSLTGGDVPRLVVDTPACSGEIHLDGATVTRWAPAGADEVLWVSEHARFGEGVAIRGGVPICAPWFATGRAKNRSPQHGFFRNVRWLPTEVHRDDDDVTVVLTLPPLSQLDADGVESAPADLTATYTVTFGATLRMSLTIASPSEAMELEEALHTYLRVSDIASVHLEGLDGARYADRAPGGRAVNAQSGDVRFLRETDRVYASTDTVTLVDGDRRVVVGKAGSNSTVVWNPWERKAAEMSDFGDDEWRGMVCVEAANALAGHVKLEAGGSHTLTTTISLQDA
ncbi:D-hexose-6-phosphate mutarotase [Mobilicoccus massiliensis]|uniref:D-hexose-6-phosphate mutarotase n=1 Tax=Mobilicoccus massiliensis TaxID=1522310 RepID=UPI00058F1514|nr:D-hexose-6-phosphate mutarotase [Mobilicoccus massiliensis]